MKNSEQKTILLVEDDKFLSELYDMKLRENGYTVVLAEDGQKALRLLKEKRPDLVLLDIILPKIDGIEVLRTIKKNKSTKDIPVVLLTNLSQRDEVKKGLSAGADDYLIKAHFMPSEVVLKIRKYFE